MNSRDLKIFLLLEIIAVVWAGLVFRIFDSRLLAGFMAGSYFVASGLYMFMRVIRWPQFLRSLTFYPLCVHVFVISIPMVFVRFMQYQDQFEDVLIWGLPGPVFHRISSTVFMILIAVTAADLYRSRQKLKN